MLRDIIDVATVLIALIPIGVKVFGLLAHKSHNQKLVNLSERAKIIVTALDQSGFTNEEKKASAMEKLALYAKEVGIKVTADQIDDYIESAVNFIRVITTTK